jgi:hypothetical protein
MTHAVAGLHFFHPGQQSAADFRLLGWCGGLVVDRPRELAWASMKLINSQPLLQSPSDFRRIPALLPLLVAAWLGWLHPRGREKAGGSPLADCTQLRGGSIGIMVGPFSILPPDFVSGSIDTFNLRHRIPNKLFSMAL